MPDDFDPVAFAAGRPSGAPARPGDDDFDPVAFAMQGRSVLSPSAERHMRAEPLLRDVRAPSRGDAFVGELVQGATFGFADEIQGMANGQGMRDEMRRQLAANREAHPGFALAGGVVGGALTAPITGAGLAGTLGSVARAAAVEGAIAGAGYSDADTIGGRLTGAAIGGATAGAAAKAVPWAGRKLKDAILDAPKRQEEKMIRDLVGSTNPSARNKLLGKGGTKASDVADALRSEPELVRARGDAPAMYEATKSVANRLDDEMATVYKTVDDLDPGIDAGAVRSRIKAYTDTLRKRFMPEAADEIENAVETKLSAKGGEAAPVFDAESIRNTIAQKQKLYSGKGVENKAIRFQLNQLDEVVQSYKGKPIPQDEFTKLAASMSKSAASELPEAVGKKVTTEIDDVIAKFAKPDPRNTLKASEMRSLVSAMQRQAYQGAGLNPSVSKETSREASMALREMLNAHVEKVSAEHLGDVAPIRALNKKRAIVASLEDVTERSATRDVGATKVAPFSLENAERLAKSPGAALASVLSGNALPYLGVRGAVAGARGADAGLAKLVTWIRARGGVNIPRNEILERAAKLGVSRELAGRIAAATSGGGERGKK